MTPAATLAKHQARAKREALEFAMRAQLRALRLDDGMLEQFQVDPARKFRWDFAFPADRLVLEVNGGQWMEKGAHNTGAALARDAEKQAIAAIHGYRTLIATTEHVKSGAAAQWVAICRGRDA